MTKEERLEGNEIIGRYIGKSFQLGHISDIPGKLPEEMNKRWLKYHRDWNELIPVVKKTVEEIRILQKAVMMTKEKDYTKLCDTQLNIQMAVLTWDIVELWSAVIAGIQVIKQIKDDNRCSTGV